jgi:hypothetical protein
MAFDVLGSELKCIGDTQGAHAAWQQATDASYAEADWMRDRMAPPNLAEGACHPDQLPGRDHACRPGMLSCAARCAAGCQPVARFQYVAEGGLWFDDESGPRWRSELAYCRPTYLTSSLRAEAGEAAQANASAQLASAVSRRRSPPPIS